LHYMAYNHLVGIVRTDLSSCGSTWLVVRTNFPKGKFAVHLVIKSYDLVLVSIY
jgi:hypothetical protein